WNPLGARPPGGGVPVDPGADFTAAQVAREDAFHAALRPWSLSALAVGVLVPVGLALTPWGARLVTALARPLGGGWVWQVLLGVLGLTLLGRLASLPLSARAEVVLRRYGLSTQTWSSWLVDAAKSWAVSTGLLLVVALVFYAVARATPHWWVWLSGAAAVLVLVVSFAYPVVVEPLFNKFTPMPAGQLRDSLVQMARTDGVPVRDVLVADASRRTTALNAYVSGFGATRRIVVYDTLLSGAPPEQVRLVVAHELGHAKANDVLYGSLVGALAAAAAVPLLALVLGSGPLLRRAGATGAGDPRSLALLLATVAVVSLLTQPGQMLVSRHIEARADVHALDLTRDPDTFVQMQRELAVTNLSDLDPPAPIYLWFGSHPTGPERTAMARDWALLHGQPVPPPLAAPAATR
ncbi:MAG TPA: M48 family metallopeptidase, partial [Actinomycetes bacterium]|nr:M48 family metallopeptidase [Actinomycetes bacterium]